MEIVVVKRPSPLTVHLGPLNDMPPLLLRPGRNELEDGTLDKLASNRSFRAWVKEGWVQVGEDRPKPELPEPSSALPAKSDKKPELPEKPKT